MREARQLSILLEILEGYSLQEPLSRYLKEYFRSNKQMGSNDRRLFSDAIYNYYRIRHAFPVGNIPLQVTVGSFLCSNKLTPFLEFCMREYTGLQADDFSLPIEEKIILVKKAFPDFDMDKIFTNRDLLSPHVDQESFLRSFLEQPFLWIRPREKYKSAVLDELDKNAMTYKIHESGAIAFPNRTSLESLDSYKSGYFEIQDLSSQQCLASLNLSVEQRWWDACAASGGKSLALLDREPSLKLTVSDVRKSILDNLDTRFKRAGILQYESILCDLTNKESEIFSGRRFDGILADVPCSGSGTWARTPEWLSMFQRESLLRFNDMQKKIVSRCTESLEPGGTLLYSTCSVFTSENEEISEFIRTELQLQKISERYIQGAAEKADTMFVAMFKKL